MRPRDPERRPHILSEAEAEIFKRVEILREDIVILGEKLLMARMGDIRYENSEETGEICKVHNNYEFQTGQAWLQYIAADSSDEEPQFEVDIIIRGQLTTISYAGLGMVTFHKVTDLESNNPQATPITPTRDEVRKFNQIINEELEFIIDGRTTAIDNVYDIGEEVLDGMSQDGRAEQKLKSKAKFYRSREKAETDIATPGLISNELDYMTRHLGDDDFDNLS